MHIAYQTVGDGPVDLVIGLPWITHLVVWWEDPITARFYRELASFTRLILFDKRGVGLSDREVGIPTFEERMDDFRAVMDAVGSKKALILGFSESAPMSLLFAAAHPDRTLGVITIGGMAKNMRSPDYPWGETMEESERDIARIEREWGTSSYIEYVMSDPFWAPSRANDVEFKRWVHRLFTFAASPSSAIAMEKMARDIDVRSVLPAIHVPTLVLAADAGTDLEQGKYIARNVSGAKFVQLPGREHIFMVNREGTDAVIRAIREFIKDLSVFAETERVLTTVLFTDIVDSTRRALEVGDRAWGRLLGDYQERARVGIARYRGNLIKSTGDGLLAIFDGPTRAVRCAHQLDSEARNLGLETRSGLHSGECVLKDGDVQGIAVHIASRVSELAEGGEILVSGTVRDLSVGSEVKFKDRGVRNLKGVDGEWRTYSVVIP